MSNLTNGLVITLVGMGGTLLSLGFIILLVELLKKVFPYRDEADAAGKEAA
jgi:hypothetical protein